MKKPDPATIRRANLKSWVDKYGSPSAEKSYFGQLISGAASFGERAARRLEEDYGMGDGYLDRADVEHIDGDNQYDSVDDACLLLELFKKSTPLGRQMIMQSAVTAEKIPLRRLRAIPISDKS